MDYCTSDFLTKKMSEYFQFCKKHLYLEQFLL